MARPNKPNSEASRVEQSPAEDGLRVQIQQLRAQIWQYVVSNLLAVIWNLALLAGGLIFLSYFASIGFMPQLDFESSITLLAAAAITGAGLLISLGMVLVLPGLYWRFSALRDERLKALWYQKKIPPYYYLKEGYALEAVHHPNCTYFGWPLPPIVPDKFYSQLCSGLWFSISNITAIAILISASIVL